MRLLRSIIVLGAASLLVVGMAAPASAARSTEYDVWGDARPKLDILRVDFRHTDTGARAVIHVRNLKPTGQFVFAVANRHNTVRFGLSTTKTRAGAPAVKRFYKFRNGQLSRKQCPRAKSAWAPRHDRLTMWFPRRCFKALPKRIVLAAGSTVNFPSGRTADQGPVAYLRR